MTHRAMTAAVITVLLTTGCGSTSTTVRGAGGGTEAGGATVECGLSTYDPAVLADAPSASDLPEGPAGAVDDVGEPAFDPSLDWKVVHQSDDRVDLVRELDELFDNGGGDVRTHESRTLERVTGATNVPDGTWMLMAAAPCTQRLPLDDDLNDADLTLARSPSPADTSIELLVRERACASGRSAEGRIQLVELDETATQVGLRIGVRPQPGDSQDCQGNPATPFTIELDEPLGERVVVDAWMTPPRAVTVDTAR